MLRSHRIRLDPTPAQDALFRRHAGFARLAYNWAVGEFKAGLSVDDFCGDKTLRPRFNAVKSQLWSWHSELSANASKGAIIDCGRAIDNWVRYRRALRDGKKPGVKVRQPRAKKRGSRPAFRADNGPGTIRFDGRRIILPVKMGGAVKMSEALRWVGKVKTVRISRRAGRWYASVIVDDGLSLPPVIDNGMPAIGVDLGVKTMAVCSDGVMYDAPKPLRALLSQLRRANKSLSRKRKGSQNWHKQVAAVQRLHARIASLRSDAIHKATTDIVRRAGSVSAEDLNIIGMVRNRRLARAISDIGMGEFLRQLEYKCAWAGIPFRRIDRWYPSSRLCHRCGWRNDGLTLAMRDWDCGGCGVRLDRDVNAAVNIRDYERPGAARHQPVESSVRPATAPAAGGETGTVVISQLRLF